MKDSLIFNFLIVKQNITNFLKYIMSCLISIKNIKITNTQKEIKNVLAYYIIFKLLNNLIYLSNKITYYLTISRDYFNLEFEKIHITKLTYENEKHIIIDNSRRSNCIKFDNLNNHIDKINCCSSMSDCILLSFDLINRNDNLENNDGNLIERNEENQPICIKDLFIKYNDDKEEYDHTLENILRFNYIFFNDNSKIIIKMFKDKKIIKKEFNLVDIKDKHINTLTN